MRKVGLLAFGVTSLVLVPVVLHELTAGPQQVAKLFAPGSSSLALGGATIDLSADRSIVDPGETVHVTLRATAPKTSKVSVSVLVLEHLGTYNGRVPQPPDRLLLETVTLEAGPEGGAARELAVRLPGHRKAGEMDLAQYTVLAMAPATAAKLDKLRRRAQREGAAPGFDPMGSEAPKHGAFNELYYNLSEGEGEGEEGEEEVPSDRRVARVDVMARPAGSTVSIRAPERAVVGQEVTVAVQVTNPTKRHVKGLEVSLREPGTAGSLGLAFDQVTLSAESMKLDLAPRATGQVEFRVTAHKAGTLGLYATIWCSGGDDCEYDERLHDGNLEAIEIAEAPKGSPPVAASR